MESLIFGMGYKMDFSTIVWIVAFFLSLPSVVFFLTIIKGERKEKTNKDSKVENPILQEETKKDSSKVSSSIPKKGEGVLSKFMGLIVTLTVLFIIWSVSLGVIEAIKGFSGFSSNQSISSQEKEVKWGYCQKGKFDLEPECDWKGNDYEVRNLVYTEENSSFELCWGFGCTTFQSDIGSPSTGSYHNLVTGEEGRYSGFEKNGAGFSTATVVCTKACQKDCNSFTIFRID